MIYYFVLLTILNGKVVSEETYLHPNKQSCVAQYITTYLEKQEVLAETDEKFYLKCFDEKQFAKLTGRNVT